MSAAIQKTENWWGKLKSHIPVTSKVIAVILLVLNIFFPGLGTIIMSCVGGSFSCEHVVVGLLQMLLAFLIIGWIWSVIWGVFLVMRSTG